MEGGGGRREGTGANHIENIIATSILLPITTPRQSLVFHHLSSPLLLNSESKKERSPPTRDTANVWAFNEGSLNVSFPATGAAAPIVSRTSGAGPDKSAYMIATTISHINLFWGGG